MALRDSLAARMSSSIKRATMKPDESDRVTCPQGSKPLKPTEVWESTGLPGKPRKYGVLPKHSHGDSGPGEECDHSGLTAQVERVEKKEATLALTEFWPSFPGVMGWYL